MRPETSMTKAKPFLQILTDPPRRKKRRAKTRGAVQKTANAGTLKKSKKIRLGERGGWGYTLKKAKPKKKTEKLGGGVEA